MWRDRVRGRFATLCRCRLASGAATLLLTAAGYLASAELGYRLVDASSGLAFFWPPAGLMVALLVVVGPRRRGWCAAAVLPSEMIVDGLHGAPLAAGMGWGAVNVLEISLAAAILVTVAGRRPRCDTQRDFYALVVASLTAPALCGLAGAAVLHATFGDPFEHAWLSWWLGDAIGIL